ncbi:hypothetical protein BGW42_005487 [Actinomortierella wolfii]|nr:hypothetical protein BGW42_005487 [Actinomortierella wolfii]
MLSKFEPSLRGATGAALFATYKGVVEERRALDTFLTEAAVDMWRETETSKMALRLADIDTMVRERERRRQGVKDEGSTRSSIQVEEADIRKTDDILGIKSSRQRKTSEDGDTDDNRNEESADDAIVVSNDAATRDIIGHFQYGQRVAQSRSESPMAGPESTRHLYPTYRIADVNTAGSSSAPFSLSRPRYKRRASIDHADDKISDLLARVIDLESRNRELEQSISNSH